MLKHTLIHPEINAILARAGHHAKVLIADGHYPASTTLGPNADLVSLNLTPGTIGCVPVLEALLTAIPVDAVNTMGIPADDPYAIDDPPIWAEYRKTLDAAHVGVALEPIQKWDFYEAVRGEDLVLTIQTGELQTWANLLLTIGVRQD